MLLNAIKQLRSKGVLGINKRNSDFIFEYNDRKFYPRADDKILCKRLAIEAGIAVPELYCVISSTGEIGQRLPELSKLGKFVIKPANGSGGEGIVVIDGTDGENFRKSDGQIVDEDFMRFHISDIIYGLYSLGGQPDRAMIEYRVNFDPVFEKVTYQGVPDVRIIVFQGVPVMGMLRLPTKMSSGRANLHQGAIGAGIDFKTGKTLGGVWQDKPVNVHPDTGVNVSGLSIPNWKDILELASRCYDFSNLGYLGADIVLDRDKGPLMLEINARPGLAVQIANREGLELKLEKVKANIHWLGTTEEKVIFSMLYV